MQLPVIIGLGGINPAGRSSLHQAYRRLVIDALPDNLARDTWQSLAALTGLSWDGGELTRSLLREATLVRRIEGSHFDVEAVPWNQRLVAHADDYPMQFRMLARHLPDPLPAGWRVEALDDRRVHVEVEQGMAFLHPTPRAADVQAADQLPRGFDPASLYPSRNHPRGLQMTVFAASDALGSTGLDWDSLRSRLSPDQVAVYVGSGMSQLDQNGNGGMLKARANGRKVTSKQCPLGFAEMPADFINAYVLGSFGSTGTNMGACASFLYNLRQAVTDIQAGRCRVAFVGSAEAPITPEIMDGYATMGALASDKGLRELDGLDDTATPDHRRACRPFSSNCGFTIAESAQVVVLCDDALALELGADILGAVPEVFVSADGHKKSISAPGVGNYITVARALSSLRKLVGDKALADGGFVQAHGTGTPQNRVTESHILSVAATEFGIRNWPVVAVKAFLGHSIGCAGGDQLAATLGSWAHGWLPGIASIDHVAKDVHQRNLDISAEHKPLSPDSSWALINAKGFGGNNASAVVLSPTQTRRMLEKRHGKAALKQWQQAGEPVRSRRDQFEQSCLDGSFRPVYHFDHNVLGADDLSLSRERLQLGDQGLIDLDQPNPYADMC
ncbi:MAG: beta-ketoacyl synthase [Halieaceae bacterium]|nr:beta-ketoacyl synthase [Halieaceae bacterium]